MAVRIRLKRMGAKKLLSIELLLQTQELLEMGSSLKKLDIMIYKDPVVIKVDEEAVQKWLKNGAQPSDTVRGC